MSLMHPIHPKLFIKLILFTTTLLLIVMLVVLGSTKNVYAKNSLSWWDRYNFTEKHFAKLGSIQSNLKLTSNLVNLNLNLNDSDSFNNLKSYNKNELERLILNSVPDNLRKNFSKILPHTLGLSKQYKIDPLWVLSIMWVESNFQFDVQSPRGALGPMQIMPKTRDYIFGQDTDRAAKSVAQSALITQIKKLAKEHKEKISNNDRNLSNGALLRIKTKKSKGGNTSDTGSGTSTDSISNSSSTQLEEMILAARLESLLEGKTLEEIILDPFTNIEIGIIYLKFLLMSFNCQELATVAYNMGPTWVNRRLEQRLPVGQKNNYLNKVRKAYDSFAKNLGANNHNKM